MLRSLLIGLLISVVISADCHSQFLTQPDPFPNLNHALFIVPQYVALSGMRFDYEQKLKNGKKWLVLSPQFYADRNGFEQFEKMSGVGFNAAYKKFLSHSTKVNDNGVPRTNVYFSTGPLFQYFSLTGPEEYPEIFVEDGIEYIRFNTQDVTTTIYRAGVNVDFGLQFVFGQFSLDLYSGVGMRMAFDKNWRLMDNYNDYWTDLGYTGFLLNGGVRLGLMFR